MQSVLADPTPEDLGNTDAGSLFPPASQFFQVREHDRNQKIATNNREYTL